VIPFWTLVRGELHEGRGNLTLWVLLVTTILTTVVAVVVGSHDLRGRLDQAARRRQQLQQSRAKGPLMAAWVTDPGLRGLRAPDPASLWIRGLDAEMPPWWDFTPAGPTEAPPDPSTAIDPEVGAVLDVGSALRLFLSVLALWWGFETVSGSRTRGTLQATLNQPVGCRVLVAAKLLAAGLALTVVLLLVGGTAWVTSRIFAPDAMSAVGRQVLFALAVSAWGYLMTVVVGAMLTGVLVRRRGRAMAIVAGVWLYVAFLGPQLITFGSRALVPTIARPLVEFSRQQSFDARFLEAETSVGRVYLQKIGAATIGSNAALSDSARLEVDALWRANAHGTRQILEAFDRRWRDDQAAQGRVRFWLMWANPGSLFLNASTETAGTGEATQARWREAVTSYSSALNRVFYDDPPRLSLLVPGNGGLWTKGVSITIRSDVRARDLTPFQPIVVPVSTRLRDGLPATIGLFGYVVVLAMLTFATFSRTDD
jgi:ABC-type transport system involved in multi-copper enzyme maturation permease subunit